MPNHITNILTSDCSLKEVIKTVKSSESEFDFNKIVPMPGPLHKTSAPATIISEKEYKNYQPKHENDYPITKKMQKDYFKRYGAYNWYDWALRKWGTKWNAYNIIVGKKSIEFDTAWGTPEPVFVRLSEMFPKHTFTVKYADEDIGTNCGTLVFKNGETIEDIIGDDEFACEVKGYDYQEYKQEYETNTV